MYTSIVWSFTVLYCTTVLNVLSHRAILHPNLNLIWFLFSDFHCCFFFFLLELNFPYLTHCCYELIAMIFVWCFFFSHYAFSWEATLFMYSYCVVRVQFPFDSLHLSLLYMYLLIYIYIDHYLLSYNYNVIINFIHYVTCQVPSVTRFAFFDGIHISMYLHECKFIFCICQLF